MQMVGAEFFGQQATATNANAMQMVGAEFFGQQATATNANAMQMVGAEFFGQLATATNANTIQKHHPAQPYINTNDILYVIIHIFIFRLQRDK